MFSTDVVIASTFSHYIVIGDRERTNLVHGEESKERNRAGIGERIEMKAQTPGDSNNERRPAITLLS